VYLRDYDFRQSLWPQALSCCFDIPQDGYAADDPWKEGVNACAKDESNSFREANSLAFVHADSDAFRGSWVTAAADWLSGHIVFITTPGGFPPTIVDVSVTSAAVPITPALKNRLHACYWSAQDFTDNSRFEVQNLVAAIKCNDPNWWKWLQPSAIPECLLSWALYGMYDRSGMPSDLSGQAKREYQERVMLLKSVGTPEQKTAVETLCADDLTLENARQLINALREDI